MHFGLQKSIRFLLRFTLISNFCILCHFFLSISLHVSGILIVLLDGYEKNIYCIRIFGNDVYQKYSKSWIKNLNDEITKITQNRFWVWLALANFIIIYSHTDTAHLWVGILFLLAFWKSFDKKLEHWVWITQNILHPNIG